jgi:predicted ATPase
MINSIEIKNFKSIKKKHFALRNLNILLGLNGMGKSSFIQSLLVLRQSYDLRSGYNNRLEINNGSFVKLGSTKDVLYQYSKNEDFTLNIDYGEKQNINLEFEYEIEADYFKLKDYNKDEVKSNLKDLSNTESLFKDNFQYLNAHRLEPTSMMRKNYSSVVSLRNIGNQGEYTAHYLEVHNNDEVVFENVLHKDSWLKDLVTGKEIVNKRLINQVNLWMGEITPNVNIRVTSVSSEFVKLEYDFKQPNFGYTNRYMPENVGFGITYGLPVVVALLKAKAGDLVIIENPESHIHPRGQAELGRLIALVAQNDVQVIIETHSDHILNGIRVAIKETDIDRNKVIAFYFKKMVTVTEQYSNVTDIKIDKNGTLSNYPENLLDEWSNQLSKLI